MVFENGLPQDTLFQIAGLVRPSPNQCSWRVPLHSKLFGRVLRQFPGVTHRVLGLAFGFLSMAFGMWFLASDSLAGLRLRLACHFYAGALDSVFVHNALWLVG